MDFDLDTFVSMLIAASDRDGVRWRDVKGAYSSLPRWSTVVDPPRGTLDPNPPYEVKLEYPNLTIGLVDQVITADQYEYLCTSIIANVERQHVRQLGVATKVLQATLKEQS
jgi:hypothetical protein